MRADKKSHLKPDKKTAPRSPKRVHMGYSKKTALLEEAITQMNAGKYGRSSAALKELLNLDPQNMEARRLFATLHLRLGSLIPARQAFDSLINEAVERQDYWLAESLLREYLAAGPRCVPFLEKLGSVFEEKGDALEAVIEYGKAIDILLEDPDPDNARRPAQLYGKIRELAPASPTAFRLASWFNAQTGELIRSPLQTPTEVPASNGADVVSGDIVRTDEAVPSDSDDRSEPAPTSTADGPVAGSPPKDSLAQGLAVVRAESDKAGEELQGPGQSGLPEPYKTEQATVGGDRSIPSNVPVNPYFQPPLDGLPSPACAREAASVTAPLAIASDDSALPSALRHGQTNSIEPVPALMSLAQHDAITIPIVDEMSTVDDPPVPSIARSESASSPLHESGLRGSAPAPMPWDQIEDGTIHIADGVLKRDDPSVAASAPAAMAWDQAQGTTIHIPDVVPEPDLVPAEPVPQFGSMTSGVQAAAGSAPTPACMSREQVEDTSIQIVDPAPEQDTLSTESVIESGSMMTEVPAPTESAATSASMPWAQVEDTTIQIVDPAPERDTLSTESVIGSGSMMAEVPAPTESATTPASMPWDQVEDTTIQIVEPAPKPDLHPDQSGFMMTEDHPSADTEPVASPRREERAQHDLVHPVSFESELRSPINSTDPALDMAQRADSSLSELQRPVETDSAPAFMPWHQVQDTTIHIVDPAPERDTRSADSVIQSGSMMAEVPAPAESAATPASMPWDQVQETTIQISDVASEQVVSQASVQEPDSAMVVVQRSTTIGPESIQKAIKEAQEAILRLAHAPTDAASPIPDTQETAAASTSTELRAIPKRERPPATAGSESSPASRTEPAKHGGFSWQAISQAWKFGKHAPAEESKPDAMSPRSPGCEESLMPSGLRPAEPTAYRSWEQASSSVLPVDDIQADTRQADGAHAVTMGNERAWSSNENVPFAAQKSVSDAYPRQAGDEHAEAPLTLSADRDPVAPIEPEFRLQRVVDASCLPTDTLAGAESVEALDRSVGEASQEIHAKSYEARRPGEPAFPSPSHRDASEAQQDIVRVAPSVQVSTDEVVMRPWSLLSEPNLQAEGHLIQPVLEESSDQASAGPVMEHQNSSMALQEDGTHQAIEATQTHHDSGVDNRGSVASSLVELIHSPQSPPSGDGDRSHWKTGEVAIQVHRPAPHTPQNAGFGPAPQVGSSPATPQDQPLSGSSAADQPEDQDEWSRTGAAIRFTESLPVLQRVAPAVAPEAAPNEVSASSAAAAVEYLFASTGSRSSTAGVEPVAYPKPGRRQLRAKLARARIGVSILIRSCFSTTRAMVLSTLALVCSIGTLTAIGLGAVAVTWMVMEESPSSAFRRFTTKPVRTISDTKQNGYVLLLGFDASPGPVGLVHQGEGKAAGCLGQDSDALGGHTEGSVSVASRLFRTRDPVSAIQARRDTIKGWVGKSERALARYTQWLKLPFEDSGYGQSVNLPCRSITFAHRVYVAEGLLLGMDTGMARLEADMEAWRTVLAQARTLPLKTMALQAVQDDVAAASGLLLDPGFDVKMLGRITHMVRPLDPDERSLRWPMQSELVRAAQHTEAQIKAQREGDLPLYAATAAILPLPKQARLNHYAEYFETASHMTAEHPYGGVPTRTQYIHAPADNVMDYFRDPIENLIGLEPLPEWSRYSARLDDLDVRLRLVRLQAWLRRGPQDPNLAGRIAKAGQDFYDPYTGFPMLVNRKKAALYSVGHDGRDQDADPDTDIVVGIPIGPAPVLSEDSGSAMSP